MKSTEYPYFSDKEEQNKRLYEEEGTFERERNLMKSYYPKKQQIFRLLWRMPATIWIMREFSL